MISTSIYAEIPPSHCGFIMSRSGLFVNENIVAFPGVIDSDYRGEIKVLLHNMGHESFIVSRHMKCVQMVIVQIHNQPPQEANVLSQTGRGQRGFGHSGY